MSQEVSKGAEQAQGTKTTPTTLGEAVNVLIQAAELGRMKGIYSWEDSAVIGEAIKLIKTPPQTATATESPAADSITEES